MLEVKDIDVFYGDLHALWEVSFEVKEGEIVSLVGSNGAGKSTVLNTISGLLKPHNGSIEFLGNEISGVSAYRIVEYGIVQIPEARRLFTDLTTVENLELGALKGEARKRRVESIEWVFELFPILKERAKQAAGTLSGGEQQMLAIARGLMASPRLLMFDEPSLGLAPILVKQVFKIIEKINQEGITILLVEQNVRHSLSISNRTYVLENGRITLEGKGKELLENKHVKEAYLGL
jgi:branched-chain amino acid transport system ATP-binding protein